MRPLSLLAVAAAVSLVGCKCTKTPSAPTPTAAPEVDAGHTVAKGHVLLQVGPLAAEVPTAPKRPAFAGKPLTVAPVTALADDVKLDPQSDPALEKYFQQLFVARDTGDLLVANGAAVDGDRGYDEFFQLYEENRYRPLLISREESGTDEDFFIKQRFLASVPSVVTPDVVLHNLHLFFDFALAHAEEETFTAALGELLEIAFDESLAQRKALAGTPWADAALDNLVFLEVARVLLAENFGAEPAEPSYELPSTATQLEQVKGELRDSLATAVDARLDDATKQRVKVEVLRVLNAKETLPLTVFAPPPGFKEDYSQYTPRGHYVKTPSLTHYFLAMMWLSRVPLAFSSESAVRSAVLLTLATARPEVRAYWEAVHDAVSALVGPPDDLTFDDVAPVVAKAAQQGPLTDAAAFAALQRGLGELRAPQVQGVLTKQAQGPTLTSQKAMHFFSQRAVIDAALLQGLVNPQVPAKSVIRALEVPDVLGSKLAGKLLAPEGFDALEGYTARHDALAKSLAKQLEARQTRELAAGWLAAVQPLLEGPATAGPRFMQTEAWATLRLSTWLASYAELKHDTVLYAKQSAAEMGGPGSEDTEESIDDRGYVVPDVAVYARVGVVLSNLRAALEQRNLFPADLDEAWGRFAKLVAALEVISRKELKHTPLTPQEYHLIKFIGGDLEHFWEATLVSKPTDDREMLLNDNNARIIADIFTGPGGITHVASGWVHPVYVAFPRDGKIAIGRGGVLSFYEVDSPTRLSDEDWRKKLVEKPRPKLPAWTSTVFARHPETRMNWFSPYE